MKSILLSLTPQGVWVFRLLRADGSEIALFQSAAYANVIYLTKLWLEWSTWSEEKLLSELAHLPELLRVEADKFRRGAPSRSS